ncbi:MAG: hypothetical protein OEL54_06570, partial [Flavobacteriaceae bacterium]|nr:hypothetical protein [Flavobacteriaceae bacterium]
MNFKAKRVRFLLKLFPLVFFLATYQESFAVNGDSDRDILKSLDTIYVQSITGQKKDEFRNIFYKSLEKFGNIKVVELLPDNFANLGIMRLKIMDFQVWEVKEPIIKALSSDYATIYNQQLMLRNMDTLKFKSAFPDFGGKLVEGALIRRNALISVKISLFDGISGKPLLIKTFSQPFQQIYITPKSINERPSKNDEMSRVTNLLLIKILEAFNPPQNKFETLNLEEGEGEDWISKNIYDFGNNRIKKGNRYALNGDIENAIWIWKLILFSPEGKEFDDIYIRNKASAYYNLGRVFHLQEDWWFAAKMFSQANRLNQKLKYAQ